MTAKQLLDGMMLSYFRHLVGTNHTPSESVDFMVGKLLVPGPEPTVSEARWLHAVATRIKAELTVDKKDNGEPETPLFDKIGNESEQEKADRKAAKT